jgi:hypothetical protein
MSAPRAFRLECGVLAQPLIEDPAALTAGPTGQLPVDLCCDLRPPGTSGVDHTRLYGQSTSASPSVSSSRSVSRSASTRAVVSGATQCFRKRE